MQFGVLVLMVLWDAVCGELVTVWAHFCDIDARVLSGMQVTVQVHVLGGCCLGCSSGRCCGQIFARVTAGLCLGRSSGGGGVAFGGAGVQVLLSMGYAGVICLFSLKA